jgi:hypothetical protein
MAVFIPITHEGSRPPDGEAGCSGIKRADTTTKNTKQRIIFDMLTKFIIFLSSNIFIVQS